MEQTLLFNISPETLKNLIVSELKKELHIILESKSNTEKKNSPNLLTKKEVCKILKCSEVTLWNWENKGILIPKRTGRLVRYNSKDVEHFIHNR